MKNETLNKDLNADNLARLAADTNVSGKQLQFFLEIGQRKGMKAVEIFVERQMSRGIIPIQFGSKVKELLKKGQHEFLETFTNVVKLRDYYVIEPIVINREKIESELSKVKINRLKVEKDIVYVYLKKYVEKDAFNFKSAINAISKYYSGKHPRIRVYFER